MWKILFVEKVKIAVFASGSGSNALNIFNYFKNHPQIEISLLACNRSDAEVLKHAQSCCIDTVVFNKATFYAEESILHVLKEKQIQLIVLAGFLLKVPDVMIASYRDRILNIHPALLPKFGGKGMYGMHVHKAVIEQNEKVSGITIHLVDEIYDNGKILFREKVDVLPEDTPESLAAKIKILEHKHYPEVIEKFIFSTLKKES